MRILRRLSVFGRVAVALGLLAALWLGTVRGVDRATNQAESRRIQDRLVLARVMSRPVASWVAAAKAETSELAGALAGSPRGNGARAAIDAYLGAPRTFARSALVFDRSRVVVAASGDRVGTVGKALTPCTLDHTNERGELVRETDTTVAEMVATPSGTLSGLFNAPGTCAKSAAVALPAPGGTVLVVFGTLEDIQARVRDAAVVTNDGVKTVALDPAGEQLAGDGGEPGAAPSALRAFVGGRERPRAARYGAGAGEVVGAYQPVGDGWGVVVEQDAADFDTSPAQRPAITVAAALTAVFALTFALIAWFDLRRRRAAARADQHRQAFLSIVGHELRTPLTVIKGYTDTLASRWDSLDDARRQMLVESMAPQAQRQARVIEHLLTAAAVQAGTYARPIVGPTELVPVLAQVAAEFGPVAPLHEFEVSVAAGAEGVQADGAVLAQVVGELVDNAVKYSPSGGVVTITARRDGRGVEIVVEDDGVGLPSETRHLFDAFVQGEAVDRRVHDEGGVGVGLYIARSLVEAMGGSVRAEPRQPAGARLVVSLRPARVARPVPAGGAP